MAKEKRNRISMFLRQRHAYGVEYRHVHRLKLHVGANAYTFIYVDTSADVRICTQGSSIKRGLATDRSS